MAEVASLVRELVLEELNAGEVLEIRVVDPALADLLVRQAVNVFEQQQPDHEPACDPGPTLLAVERRDLVIDPIPVDLAAKLHQLVLQVDDLIQPGAKQIAFLCRLRLLRSHRSPPLRPRNHGWRFEGILKMKLQAFRPPDPKSLQSQIRSGTKNRLSLNGLSTFSRTTKLFKKLFGEGGEPSAPTSYGAAPKDRHSKIG
jgi:hypothetical protein